MRKYLFYLLLSIFPVIGFGQILQQGFDDITTLAGSGWTMTNQSTTPGTIGWFQGNIDVFESHTGAPTSYIGANFNNTTGNSTISNWLITPTLNLKDGDQVSFYTRTTDMPASWADRLELRMSEGATFTSPSGPTGVGSFTALLHSVNPDLTTTGYPAEWTRIDVTISGLGATAVPVNLAFRYFVTNGGPSGSASNFIGIDSVLVEEGTSGGSDYCIPEGTNVARYINNFSTTGGVENISNMASGFSTGGYGDFTATHSLTQETGESVSFTADIMGGIAGFRIWVDWNQDGVFDIVDEVAYNSTGYLATQSGSFVVPADATPGETRMRVVSHWLSTTGLVDPCATGFTYGEFEDYTFVVNGTTTPDYCIPEGTNVARYINNFSTTGGVENISNMASGFSTGGYGDFTATHSLTQETGESVGFTADIMGGIAGFRIWVDWNQDGVFDIVDEVAYNSTGYLSTQSGSFVVPADAMEGTTRMRVVSHWLSTTGLVDPCATGFAYGEFEDYTFNVTAGGGGPTDPVYCEPATTSANWEWITNVNFAGIDNTTAGNIGLNDYTDQVAEVTADSVVPISVSIESDANDYVWVFIDWNQNGILDDAGEVTVLATATNVSGPYTEDVIVPADALEGETRMRVMLRYSFDPIDPDPCTSYQFGEIEDYTVNVTAGGGGPTDPVYCEPATTNVNWEYITNVNFAGIDNTTDGNVGLNDYTDQVAEVTADSVVPISVSIESDANDYVWVFIDWNQNGILDDAGEVTVLATATNVTGPYTEDVIVPADALEGETRMRVMLRYSFDPIDPDPCFSYTFGEIEDYTVNVTAGGGGPVGDPCAQETLSNAFENGQGFINTALIAHDFRVEGGVTFTVDHFEFNAMTLGTTASVTLSFYENSGTGPGDFIGSTPAIVPTLTTVGTAFGFNVVRTAVDLPTPMVFEGGATGANYFVAVNISNPTDSYWESTSVMTTPNTGYWSPDGGVTWTAVTGGPWDGVFEIAGTCEGEPIEPEGCEWTVTVQDTSWGDEVSWELRDSGGNVLLSSAEGAYGNGYFDERSVIAEGPVEFFIEAVGTFNDNTPSYTVSNGTEVLVTGQLLGGDEATYSDLNCDDTGGTFPAPYCGPIEFDFDVEPITNVVVADISNPSDAALNGSPEHEDFTAIVGNMEQGGSYDIALEGNTNGSWTNRFVVFIDWNQNDILDDEGEVYEMDNTIAGSTGTDGQQALGTIEVPADAELGTTRMRVKKIFGTTDFLDPCLGAGFGQVEDYTINVTEGTTGPGDDCSQATPSNGFENGHGFINSAHIAHDFSVDAETTFTAEQFTFNILQQNPTATVTLSFYEETAGAPGAFIDTTPAIVPTSATTIGTAFGFNVVSTVVDLPAGFEFEGGATGANYFVAVNISNPTDSYWESTSVMTTPNTGYWSPDGGVTWTALTGGPWDGVFEIAGTCEEGEEPEPGDGCFVTGTFDQWPSTTHVAQCIGTVEVITAAGWAGEFSKVQVTAGTEYIFASSISTDFITIADEDEEITFATGTGSVTWTSPIDQVIRFYTHLNDECEIEEVSRTRSVQCGDIPPPPANDECADAIALSCGDSATGSTIAANNSGGNAAGDVFYTFTGTGTPEMVTVSLCGSSYDTYLRVFTDCTLGTEIAFNDDSCGLQSQLTFMSDGTSTYVIMVEGFSSNTGNYTIDITCAAPPEFTCEEQEVLSNGLENGLFFGGDTDQSLAVDVIVGDEGFIVYGSYVNVFVDGNLDLNFSVNFYADAAGVPGTLEHSSAAYFTENEFLGNAFGFDVYSYTVGFENPFTAEANTTYWMEIISDGVAWEATSASFLGSGLVFSNTNTGGAWTLDPATELVYDLICEPLGVSDMNSFDFTYYPNPVKDMLYIDAKQSIENVEVFNLAGQKVMADSKVSNGQVNVNTLTPGTYVFRVTLDGGKVETFKIIKK